MKAVVAAFNQEKALVGAVSVITNLRMELFEPLTTNTHTALREGQNVNNINYVVLKAVNSEVKKQFELWQGIFL